MDIFKKAELFYNLSKSNGKRPVIAVYADALIQEYKNAPEAKAKFVETLKTNFSDILALGKDSGLDDAKIISEFTDKFNDLAKDAVSDKDLSLMGYIIAFLQKLVKDTESSAVGSLLDFGDKKKNRRAKVGNILSQLTDIMLDFKNNMDGKYSKYPDPMDKIMNEQDKMSNPVAANPVAAKPAPPSKEKQLSYDQYVDKLVDGGNKLLQKIGGQNDMKIQGGARDSNLKLLNDNLLKELGRVYKEIDGTNPYIDPAAQKTADKIEMFFKGTKEWLSDVDTLKLTNLSLVQF